jgi:hypothetical protein
VTWRLPSAVSERVRLGWSAAVVFVLCVACGLKLDDGSTAAEMGTASEIEGAEQGRAQNQPVSSVAGPAAPDPEAALGPAAVRGFVLEGSAAYHLEDSVFLQCGFQEQWSVRFEGLAFERFQDVSLGEECELGGCFFALSGTGDLSARGRFGQARSLARELTVTRLTRLQRVLRAADLPSLNGISCAP